MTITPAQVRAARALIDWTTGRLASRANISSESLRQFERGWVDLNSTEINALRCALEATGVELIDGDEPGVKLRRVANGAGTPRLRRW
jgi:hypothetical protein